MTGLVPGGDVRAAEAELVVEDDAVLTVELRRYEPPHRLIAAVAVQEHERTVRRLAVLHQIEPVWYERRHISSIGVCNPSSYGSGLGLIRPTRSERPRRRCTDPGHRVRNGAQPARRPR